MESLKQAVIDGDKNAVVKLTQIAITDNISPFVLLQEGLIPGMTTVGNYMKSGEFFITEVLRSARAMKAGTDLLHPLLVGKDFQPKGKVVLGTVEGDMHDIGKGLVKMLLEGNGFEVIDLGVGLPAEKFVEALRESGATILGLSALLTTTMLEMDNVVKAIIAAGLRAEVKIMIGGAPTNQAFADEISADAWAIDAATGAEICVEWARQDGEGTRC